MVLMKRIYTGVHSKSSVSACVKVREQEEDDVVKVFGPRIVGLFVSISSI